MANFAVKLASHSYGIVAFDVVQASSGSAALTAAQNEADAEWYVGSVDDLNAIRASELLSDTPPDRYGRVPANPGV